MYETDATDHDQVLSPSIKSNLEQFYLLKLAT